jgi:hypothetical protein
MRGWWLPLLATLVACGDDDNGTGTGTPPESPNTLSSVSLDGAVALTWSDNPFQADPGLFQSYRVYTTSYDIDADPPRCGTDWQLEGTTVAPEFLVGALENGVPRCFSVTAFSVDGAESDRSPVRPDTPRPDARNVVLFAVQERADASGFRFWEDLNNDDEAQGPELGSVRNGHEGSIDFFVDRDLSGDLFLTPVRAGTGVEYADDTRPMDDLTSIDFAPDQVYQTTSIQAVPGFGYIFEMDGQDGFKRYGALRVTHVGQDFLIVDWAFQTDPGNPELMLTSGGRLLQRSRMPS